MRAARSITLGLTAAFLGGAGCAPDRESPPAAVGLADVAVVLDPVVPDPSWGPGFLPGVERYSAAEDPATVLPRVGPDRVLVIPEVRGLPVHWWGPLKDHFRAGGAVLFCGLDPFEEDVRVENGAALTRAAFESGLMKQARSADGFSSVRTWLHENDSGQLRGAVRLAEGGEAPWPAVEVEVEALGRWDGLTCAGIRAGAVRPAENSLAFYGRGDDRTSRLFVECREKDGSRWGVSVGVDRTWRPRILHPSLFRHLGGGRGRGGARDSLSLADLRWIRIGLDTTQAPQWPGNHLFGLSEVRLLEDPRPAEEIVARPDIPLVSPPWRHYRTTASAIGEPARDEKIKVNRLPVGSPLSPPRGESGTREGRWIPLFSAEDEQGDVLGWPVSLFIAGSSGGPRPRWGWVAMDPVGPLPPWVGKAVETAVRRLSNDAFFQYAGCPSRVYRPGEEIRVSGCWEDRRGRSGLGVAAELRDESQGGKVVRRVAQSEVPPGLPFEINLGRISVPGTQPEDYRVVILLEDRRRPGFYFDRLEQGIKALPDKPVPVQPMGLAGGRFQIRRVPFLMAGVHYAPPVDRVSEGATGHWLDPLFFDSDRVRRDLRCLKKAEVNTVFIEYADEHQAETLRYFAEECRSHSIKIVLSVAGLDPLHPDWERAARLLRAAEVAATQAITAISVNLPDDPSEWPDNPRLEIAWSEWRAEQAESGVTDGEQLEGDWRTAPQPVIRRFLEEALSRRIGWIRRQLDSLGCRQLLTARMEVEPVWAGEPPMFPGAVHLDFLSLLVVGQGRGEPGWDRALARAAALQQAAGTKPVVWHGRGLDVGPDPAPIDLSNQARWFQSFLDLAVQSPSAGCIAWSYAGGGGSLHRQDIGLTEADGLWRPAGQVLLNSIPPFRKEQFQPVPSNREAAETGGLNAEWGLIQVDGVPQEHFPGEPVRIRSGQMLRAEVINTGAATWQNLPGDIAARVTVRLTRQDQAEAFPVRPLRRAERDWVSWRAGEPGEWSWRARDARQGPFGERLLVSVGQPSVTAGE